MTDEELKEMRETFNDLVDDTTPECFNENRYPISRAFETLDKLIAAEQTRRAVRTEDVQRAIEEFKHRNKESGKHLVELAFASESEIEKWKQRIRNNDLAITALEAYQPKEEQSAQSESQPCDVYELAVYKRLGITSERAYQLIEMEKNNNDIYG